MTAVLAPHQEDPDGQNLMVASLVFICRAGMYGIIGRHES